MHGSLRVRITPAECAVLLAGKPIAEESGFPGGWRVVVRTGPVNRLYSEAPGAVELVLDSESAQSLASPEIEGVYPTIDGVRVIVEKDYPCVHPRPSAAAESTETFPAPPGFAERKA